MTTVFTHSAMFGKTALTVVTGALPLQLPGGPALPHHEPALPVLLLRTARVLLVSSHVRCDDRLAAC